MTVKLAHSELTAAQPGVFRFLCPSSAIHRCTTVASKKNLLSAQNQSSVKQHVSLNKFLSGRTFNTEVIA